MKQKIEGGKKYEVTVSCPDCTGNDDMGCFDGGSETESFATLEEAFEWGEDMTKDSIWEYEISGATKKHKNEVYQKLYGIDYEN